MKVVINTLNDFVLSDQAQRELSSRGMSPNDIRSIATNHQYRTDGRLINVVETLGINASGLGSRLVVVDVPFGIEWRIFRKQIGESVVEIGREWDGLNKAPSASKFSDVRNTLLLQW